LPKREKKGTPREGYVGDKKTQRQEGFTSLVPDATRGEIPWPTLPLPLVLKKKISIDGDVPRIGHTSPSDMTLSCYDHSPLSQHLNSSSRAWEKGLARQADTSPQPRKYRRSAE
jgi:hypothetical protein